MSELSSMVDLLRRRATEQPDDRAYVLLSEKGEEEAELSFAELNRRAGRIAAYLAPRVQKGDRALLTFPPGLDFIVAFFGCLVAGVIAVPMMPPRRTSARDSSENIVADCDPRIALTSSGLAATRADVLARLRDAGVEWIAVDTLYQAADAGETTSSAPTRADVAFLQYTSGSTSA